MLCNIYVDGKGKQVHDLAHVHGFHMHHSLYLILISPFIVTIHALHAQVIAAMKADSGVDLHSLKVDGGATKNNLLMQFQSDLLNVSLQCPVVNETTALGSAYAAGLAVGYFDSVEAIRESWKCASAWTPQMDAERREFLVSRLSCGRQPGGVDTYLPTYLPTCV
jgi:ribulose kinase